MNKDVYFTFAGIDWEANVTYDKDGHVDTVESVCPKGTDGMIGCVEGDIQDEEGCSLMEEADFVAQCEAPSMGDMREDSAAQRADDRRNDI
jgi:NADPH-dependent curcumin reductase CurA